MFNSAGTNGCFRDCNSEHACTVQLVIFNFILAMLALTCMHNFVTILSTFCQQLAFQKIKQLFLFVMSTSHGSSFTLHIMSLRCTFQAAQRKCDELQYVISKAYAGMFQSTRVLSLNIAFKSPCEWHNFKRQVTQINKLTRDLSLCVLLCSRLMK